MRPVPSQKRARKVNHNLGVTLRYKSRLPLGPGSDREAVSYSLSQNIGFGDDASAWPRQPASPPPCAITPVDPAGPTDNHEVLTDFAEALPLARAATLQGLIARWTRSCPQ